MTDISYVEKFRKALKNHGLKATPQRLEVHEAMVQLGHASADMVADWILKNGSGKVTVASVYNILAQMSSIGIYHHRMSYGNKMYFDVTTLEHAHLYDRVNNTYKDIDDEDLKQYLAAYLKKHRFRGYKVVGVDLQIVCEPSRPRERPAARTLRKKIENEA